MSTVYLPPPKYCEPIQLAVLASGLEGKKRSPDFKPVDFPLKKIGDIFRAFGEGGWQEIRLIDQCRLAMALVTNLQTLLEGKIERHAELCECWLPQKQFAQSLLNGVRAKKVFWVYLQKLFLRHEIVKNPHVQLMDNFYRLALKEGELPHPIETLINIKKNKTVFIIESARKCLESKKGPASYWESLDLVFDDFVEKEYTQKIEDKVIDQIIASPNEIDVKTLQKYLTLILDFNSKTPRLTLNLEKLIFAAEKSEHLQTAVIEHIENKLRVPPNWDLVPGISGLAIKTFEKLLGLVEFQYFELIAEIIHDQFLSKDQSEQSRLRNRTFFWMNYRDQISNIKIFLNSKSAQKFRGSFSAYQSKFGVSERLLSNIGTTEFDSEIVLIQLGNVLIVEFFRDSRFKTILINSGNDLYQRFSKSSKLRLDAIKELEDKADFRVHHVYLWQKALINFLSEKFRVTPRSSHLIIPKHGSFRDWGKIPKKVMMNKMDQKIYESYKDFIELIDQTILGHRKRIGNNIIVKRAVR